MELTLSSAGSEEGTQGRQATSNQVNTLEKNASPGASVPAHFLEVQLLLNCSQLFKISFSPSSDPLCLASRGL